MDESSLASEMLQGLLKQMKRKDILIAILIVALLLSNISWLYAWNLPNSSVTVESNDTGNANFIDGEGDIINGED